MDTVLLSTAYLPPVSWVAVALQFKNIHIETQETYPKQTFRNRCNIATSSGILSLSVPVIRINGNHTKTGEIVIDNSGKWQQMHWRSIITAYNKSPYFLFYRDSFEPIFQQNFDRLTILNQALFSVIVNLLNIKNKKIDFTSQYEVIPEGIDMRYGFQAKKMPYQIITKDLPRYVQAFEEKHGFLADLSIIDLLFNLGPDSLHYLETIKLSQPFEIKGLLDIQP